MSIDDVKTKHDKFHDLARLDPNMTKGFQRGPPLLELLSSLAEHHDELEKRIAVLESGRNPGQPD